MFKLLNTKEIRKPNTEDIADFVTSINGVSDEYPI